MELASALETERHTVGELQRLLGEMERSRDSHVEEEERGEPALMARDSQEWTAAGDSWRQQGVC